MTKLKKYWIHVVLVLTSIIFVGPFLWMFLTSLKTYEETIQVPMIWLPDEIQWVNYQIVN